MAVAVAAFLMSASASNAQNIIEVASANPSLSTFVEAIEAAGLTETLSGEGPYTVFAPTNEAFAELGNGVADRLINQNTEQLAEILGRHILTGEFMSADIGRTNARYESLDGRRVRVNSMGRSSNGGGTIEFEGTAVVQTDVDADNGVIHIVDGVAH
jgi:uncharacterized surface protein with fasciclin (FAS1) repeats